MRAKATLINKVKTKRTTPTATKEVLASPLYSVAPKAIAPVKVRVLWNKLVGIVAREPMTMMTAIVSPIALPLERTKAAKMPLLAAGMTTLKQAISRLAPKAKAPS